MKLSVGFGWVLLWLKSGVKWNVHLVQAESSCCTTLTSICPEEKGGFTSSRKPRWIPGLQEVFPHCTWNKCLFVQPQLPAVMTCITAHPLLWQNSPGPGTPCIPHVLVLPVPSRTVISPQSGRAWILVRNSTDSFPAPLFCISTLINSLWCSQHEGDIPATSCPCSDHTLYPARHLTCGIWTLATKQGTQLCVVLYTHTPIPSCIFISVQQRIIWPCILYGQTINTWVHFVDKRILYSFCWQTALKSWRRLCLTVLAHTWSSGENAFS